jgi:hypothetical protein
MALSKIKWQRMAMVVVAGLMVSAPGAYARHKNSKAAPSPPLDTIEVVGHVTLASSPVSHFICTQHYSSYYLYAEHSTGKNITLVDVTQAAAPSVLADVPYAPADGSEGLVAVAGTAALVSTDQSNPGAAVNPQTLRIMDFSDPQHPKVAREFTGVTAVGRDEHRGLVFVANSEGIWILQQHLALDPKVEEEYARYVLYSH